jgi:hypothetical protein
MDALRGSKSALVRRGTELGARLLVKEAADDVSVGSVDGLHALGS